MTSLKDTLAAASGGDRRREAAASLFAAGACRQAITRLNLVGEHPPDVFLTVEGPNTWNNPILFATLSFLHDNPHTLSFSATRFSFDTPTNFSWAGRAGAGLSDAERLRLVRRRGERDGDEEGGDARAIAEVKWMPARRN